MRRTVRAGGRCGLAGRTTRRGQGSATRTRRRHARVDALHARVRLATGMAAAPRWPYRLDRPGQLSSVNSEPVRAVSAQELEKVSRYSTGRPPHVPRAWAVTGA